MKLKLYICESRYCGFLTEVIYDNKLEYLDDFVKTKHYKIYSKHEYDKSTSFEYVTYDIESKCEIVIITDGETYITLPLGGHIQFTVRAPYALRVIKYIRLKNC